MTECIASFDIGSKNFCFYVQEIDVSQLNTIHNIPIQDRYHDDGTPTPKMTSILNELYKNGTTVVHLNIDLTTDCKKSKQLDQNVFYNMNAVLDKYSTIWDKCSIFLVEQQMSFRGKINTNALKLGQHCQSYFFFRYGKFKKVIEYPAYHKTSVLGSQKLTKGITKKGTIKYTVIAKPARKKWAVKKALEILTIKNETTSSLFKPKIKKDDLADTLIQLESFKYLYYINKSLFS